MGASRNGMLSSRRKITTRGRGHEVIVNITPDKAAIKNLVKQAFDGSLCIPDFQRDFTWPPEDVADLLRSIFRGYFIGSLLLLECDSNNPPFKPERLKGSKPNTDNPHPGKLILDGQQRLTSLLYAFYEQDFGLRGSKTPRRFFLNLKLLIEDPDNDEIVFHRDVATAEKESLYSSEKQWADGIIPLTKLVDLESFIAWKEELVAWINKNQPEDIEKFNNNFVNDWLGVGQLFWDFDVPLVTLPAIAADSVDGLAAVCVIFEKLNSKGVALSVYDLLTARLYPSKVKLHELWEEAVAENLLLGEWSEGSADKHNFGVLVLRTMALMRDIDPKPKNLINLKPENFKEDWKRAAKAMNEAIEVVTNTGDDGMGVFDKKWLPGFGLLPVLAALRAYINENDLLSEARADLRRWYWCSVFLERYSSSVETKSRSDYVAMIKHWNGKNGVMIVPFAEAKSIIGADGYTIGESASNASSVYSGVFCLLALNGAKDWTWGEDIALQDLEDHHIFPKGYLSRAEHGFDAKKDANSMNSILNRTLISDKTNKKISDTAPAEYVANKSIFPNNPDSVLERHFINAAGKSKMDNATEVLKSDETHEVFKEFKEAREHFLIEKIREVCGVETL